MSICRLAVSAMTTAGHTPRPKPGWSCQSAAAMHAATITFVVVLLWLPGCHASSRLSTSFLGGNSLGIATSQQSHIMHAEALPVEIPGGASSFLLTSPAMSKQSQASAQPAYVPEISQSLGVLAAETGMGSLAMRDLASPRSLPAAAEHPELSWSPSASGSEQTFTSQTLAAPRIQPSALEDLREPMAAVDAKHALTDSTDQQLAASSAADSASQALGVLATLHARPADGRAGADDQV